MIRCFKELFRLIRWLFTSRPSEMEGKPMEIVQMKRFPLTGFSLLSWCGRIVTRIKKEKLINRFMTTNSGKIKKQHEGGHVKQAISEHGDNWLRFYVSYFWHWLKHLPFLPPFEAAYYCNRYEVEAYANEDNPEYWQHYNRENLRGKYSIKGARKLYKKMGKRKWKEYIKTL